MNAIAAFLLGLTIVAHAQFDTTGSSDSVDSFDWDSDDTNSDGGDTSYNGMVIRVFQEAEESPTIALGTNLDELENIYCLKFLNFFESEDYDTTTSTDATFTAVTGSEVSLDDADCDIADVTESTFKIHCNAVSEGYLSLEFAFTQDDDGDYGLEYTVILGDYVWTSVDSAAKLVMTQSVMECSAALANMTTTTDDDTNDDANTAGRRLLQETTEDGDDEDDTDSEDTEDTDTESDDSEDSVDDESEDSDSSESVGISSDESGEFDEGNVRFVLSGQAFDQCDVETNGETETLVGSKLVYQTGLLTSTTPELHIVFDHFNCDLYQDPRFLIDESKVTGEEDNDSAGAMVKSVMAGIMGVVVAWTM